MLDQLLNLSFPDTKLFERWLQDRKTFIVGDSFNMCTCPLAHFLADYTGGYGTYEVCDTGYRLTNTSSWQPLPQWANDFVVGLDQCYTGPVTGAQCLTILQQNFA